jgi:outer membrane lipoprotein-sorting protein
MVRDVTLPANMTGSVGDIVTNPTASMTISVKDDGVDVGTVVIATDGSFTFTTTGGTSKIIAAGSIVTIVAPSTADATAANASVTLLGSAG